MKCHLLGTLKRCNTQVACIAVAGLFLSINVDAASIQLNQSPSANIDAISGYSNQIDITNNLASLINSSGADYATLTSARLSFSFVDDNDKSIFIGETYTDWVLDEINSALNGGKVTYYDRHHFSQYSDSEQEIANLSIGGASVATAQQTNGSSVNVRIYPDGWAGTNCEATWAGQFCHTQWKTRNWESISGYSGSFSMYFDLDQNQLNALESGVLSFSVGSDYGDFKLSSWSISAQAELVTNPVPIPATFWLFGSGLVGLIRIASRKTKF